MATVSLVTKVWIAPGCIVCDACETTCPDVFDVTDDTCLIRPAALDAEFNKPRTETIIEAAEECPVEVIKFETIEVDEADAPKPVASAPAEEAAPAAAAAAPSAGPKAETHADTPVAAADPAIQALLRATTARGGRAGIQRGGTESTSAVQQLRTKPLGELPPDARQQKVLEAAKAVKQEEADATSRRGLIGAAGIGWIAFATSSAIGGAALQRFMFPNVLEEPNPKVRLGDVGKFANLSVGAVNEDYKPQGIWIVRMEGQVAALSIVCTHLGCIPNWLEADRKFKCPCHGSGFAQDGINFEGPAPRPLERFKITVEDGVVIVDRSKKFQQEKGEWSNPDSFIVV